jgi:hypothetical protein
VSLPVKYKGIEVARVERNDAMMTFVLYDTNGSVIDEIPEYAFLMNPVLKQRKIDGKYRRAAAQAHSNPPQQSGAGYGRAPHLAGTTLTIAHILALKRALRFADEPVEDAGIRAGEIVGHRIWRVSGDRLFSCFRREYEWFPDRPARGNVTGYGVYSFKEMHYLAPYIVELQMVDYSDYMASVIIGDLAPTTSKYFTTLVSGTIEMWGTVIEHRFGYRAEYARVKSLDAEMGGADLEALRARYLPPKPL